mmetsp:Transcript_32683/g.98803  ORF Transcript_32683/g.98803 Transcript_32683/m.98803 type:complete len:251 (+) Transcript_32683:147-899(+)
MALLDRHPQAVLCVDGGAGARAHVRRRRGGRGELEGEVPEHHRQGDRALEHREDVADALPRPAPEGQERPVRRDLVRVQHALPFRRVVAGPPGYVGVLVRPQEAFRVEGVGVGPVPRVPLHVVDGHEEVHAAKDLGLLPTAAGWERVFVQRASDEQGRLGVHAQRFGKTQPDQFHLFDVVVGGALLAANHLVDLLLHLGHQLRILGQLEQRPRQTRCRCFVACDQHGDHVVSKLLAVGRFALHVHQEPKQ